MATTYVAIIDGKYVIGPESTDIAARLLANDLCKALDFTPVTVEVMPVIDKKSVKDVIDLAKGVSEMEAVLGITYVTDPEREGI